MQGRSGVTADTPSRLIFDAGEAYFNLDLTALEATGLDGALTDAIKVGATRGGSTFNPNRSIRQMEADGLLGPTRGMHRRESVAPVLTINFLEMTVENLLKAFAGATAENVGTTPDDYALITGGPILDTSYIDNVALLATYTGTPGKPVLIVVENALALNAPDFTTADQDEVVLAVPFAGTFSPSDYTAEPWRIYHPTAIVTP